MARPRAPLLSVSASGTLADTLTYASWRGRPYIKRKSTPADPQSDAQMANRALMRYLQVLWPTISDAYKTTWDTHPDRQRLSRYHCYLQANAARWAHLHGPSLYYPPTDTIDGWEYYLPSATAEVRQITIRMTLGWSSLLPAFALHRSLSPDNEYHPSNLVAIIPIHTGAYYYWSDAHVTPGVTYWYRSAIISKTGHYESSGDDIPATPLP